MKKSSNIFGEAIYEYSRNKYTKLELINKQKIKFSIDLSYYFREHENLSELEKTAIGLSKGEILDVGCATGYYIPVLKKFGTVDAIDVSEHAIRIAKERGVEECHVADVFKYNPSNKYDTITLFENNLGLGGTLSKTKKLFKILTKLLKKDGIIIAIIRHTDYKKKYFSSKYIPLWKGKPAQKFRWFYFNINYLGRFCNKFNLRLEILDEDIDKGRNMYLVRITHKF
ncbi:MAG: methyltransferase domain-containing protein [Promethearchaeota archaeon]|jgi:SAM-dependent methyltransferase